MLQKIFLRNMGIGQLSRNDYAQFDTATASIE